ncbi:unnamed protein product, partial [Closterium sp. NIES-53]
RTLDASAASAVSAASAASPTTTLSPCMHLFVLPCARAMWGYTGQYRESVMYGSAGKQGINGAEELLWEDMAFRVRHGQEAREGEERRRKRQEEVSALLVAARMAPLPDTGEQLSPADYA